MCWTRIRRALRSIIPYEVETSNLPIEIVRSNYADFELRRAILNWRDHHIENIETQLERELKDFYRTLDELLEKMSIWDLFKRGSFGKLRIQPIYQEWVKREVAQLIKAAQDDLSKIRDQALQFGGDCVQLSEVVDKGHYRDVAIAMSAMASGIAVIPTFVTMSVVSVGGILGFFGVTTIALPVVAVGILTVGGLLALGGYKAVSLRSNAIARYRKGLVKSIENQVLGARDTNDSSSIRHELQKYIEETANRIILEIDK